ncbi:MAG: oxygen-independent coproporphyrinogen III oxidase [Alphaproteobacteria bacterium]|nr:oxygen-independent coproporphyrinogen III oxidase [Alphaproteobacteria bacterium]
MMTATTIREQDSPGAYLPEWAMETLPRYTSYPPANLFAETSASAAREALMRLSPDAAISLYLHIPFCQRLCWYCGCHTSVPTASNPVDAYLEALHREIRLVGDALPQGAAVKRVHFGGGSPDILNGAQIDALFGRLRGAFRFDAGVEIAAELDPRGVTDEVISAYARNGLSRASFGVQVLNPTVQARINRIQPAGLVRHAIDRLRAAGVRQLNMDLMYGLPGETLADVIETATFAATHDADRVAVFGYAHVPWFKKHQKSIDASLLPDSEERFRQAEAAAATLRHAGYVPIGFDHFAAPGDSLAVAEQRCELRRNFQGYTDDACPALIGLGASAISFVSDQYYQNTPDTSVYRDVTARGDLPVVRGLRMSWEDKRIAAVIESLLCRFEAEVPHDLECEAAGRLAGLEAAGLIRRIGRHLSVTARGRPYVRNIAASFDRAFASAQPGRHSLAV